MSQMTSAFPFTPLQETRVFKNGESSSQIAKGKIGALDVSAAANQGTVKLAGASTPAGLCAMALEDVAAGAEGRFLVRGISTDNDLAALTTGNVLTTAASGGMAVVNAVTQRRIAVVLDKDRDLLFFNGLGI
jgi:hypothetical protein